MIVKMHTKALVAVLALLLMPLVAWADPVGTFTKVEGQVDILRSRGSEAVLVRVGDPVNMGDAIRTKRNSKTEIQFKDESVIQLAPETRITIDEYSFRGEARERGLIGLFRGKIRAIVSKLRANVVPASLGASDFNIKTPTAIAGVKGTDLIVYYDRGVSGVVFLNGFGFVFNPALPDRIVPISGGQATIVTGGTQPPQTAFPISDAYIAPYVRETTISLTGGSSGSEETPVIGATLGDLANVPLTLDATTTMALLNNLGAGGAGNEIRPQDIPVTDTHPSLLGTPVTVTVHVP